MDFARKLSFISDPIPAAGMAQFLVLMSFGFPPTPVPLGIYGSRMKALIGFIFSRSNLSYTKTFIPRNNATMKWGILGAFFLALFKTLIHIQLLDIQTLAYCTIETVLCILFMTQLFSQNPQPFSDHLAVNSQEDLESSVRRQTEILVAENAMQRKLLSIISHDVKSPLNSLRAVLTLYRENALTDLEMKHFTADIDEHLTAATMLIDNILLWAKKQSDGMNVVRTSFMISQLVEEYIKVFGPIASRKQVLLVNKTTDMPVETDKQILGIVLRNILGNAIKFSPEGGRVEVDAKTSESGFMLTIRDAGAGMPEEQVRSLFTAGRVTMTEGPGGERGAGLGLSLSQDYLKYVDGSISVQSKPGEGSIFTVRIPLINQLLKKHDQSAYKQTL